MPDSAEERALFRQMVAEAHHGDAEAIAVVAERANRHRDDPEWAGVLAEAEQILGPLDRLAERKPIHHFETEGIDEVADTVSGARIAGGMFVVAAVLAVLAYYFWE